MREPPDDRDPVENPDFGIPTKSPYTVEGHLEHLGAFFRGLKRRYPRIGWFLLALIVIGFLLGFISLNPFG